MKCIDLTNQYFSSWFEATQPCYNYRIKILDLFLIILIRKNCKWLSAKQSSTFGKERLFPSMKKIIINLQ